MPKSAQKRFCDCPIALVRPGHIIVGDIESKRLVQLCAVALLSLSVPGVAYAEPCRSQSFGVASYIVCSFDLTREDLRTYWRRDDGKPYRTFAALAEDLEGKGKSLRFAMNGGMYRNDFRPVGLYIENGRELTPADTTTLTGAPSQIPNFYKKPNGVFYRGNDEAGILETERFLAERPNANFATQSGPMLVIDGAIHPSLLIQAIASRGTAWACRAGTQCISSSRRDG
jgi:uncharacterized protein YigE (DUF2233 family)